MMTETPANYSWQLAATADQDILRRPHPANADTSLSHKLIRRLSAFLRNDSRRLSDRSAEQAIIAAEAFGAADGLQQKKWQEIAFRDASGTGLKPHFTTAIIAFIRHPLLKP